MELFLRSIHIRESWFCCYCMGRNSKTYEIVIEEGVLEMVQSVAVERRLSWAM